MADLNALLAASRIGSQAARQATPLTDNPTDDGLLASLRDAGGMGLGAVASVGNFLDLPGSSVRDLLAGKGLAGSFDQWASPLSDTNRTTGRQLLEKWGMRKNRETGGIMSGWLSDPGEGVRDLAGFAAEVVLDPFGPVTGMLKGTSVGLRAASAASRAHPVVKALGKAAINIFDTLPNKALKEAVIKPLARGGRALFDKLQLGVTDALFGPMARKIAETATKVRNQAALHSIDIAMTAQRLGYHLDVDEALDAADPASWLNPKSRLMVNAREDAIYRYAEGVYNPADAKLMARDMVTVGRDPSAPLKEVEWVNQTDQGLQVKLVDDDTFYSDTQLNPAFMQQRDVPLPQELMDTIDVMQKEVDALQQEAQGIGINLGNDIDAYGRYFNRTKSNELRKVEAMAEMSPLNWRKQYNSLVATLLTPGGRELKYKGFVNKTVGVTDLFADRYMQHLVEKIGDRSEPTLVPLMDGMLPNIIKDHIGPRHLQPLADILDTDVEDLWNELFPGGKESKTGSVLLPSRTADTFDIHDPLTRTKLGEFRTRFVDGPGGKVAVINPMLPAREIERGVLEDILPTAEKSLFTQGATRIEVAVLPEMGDQFWKAQGFSRSRHSIDTGMDIWGKDIFEGEAGLDGADLHLNGPRMVTHEQAVKAVKTLRERLKSNITSGQAPGIQPARGWWSKWENLRSEKVQDILTLNNTSGGLKKLDLATLSLNDFPGMRNEFDRAQALLEQGVEVHAGWLQKRPGDVPAFHLVTPLRVSKLDMSWDKWSKALAADLEINPLRQNEAIMDHLHQAIGRNYKDKIDKWMPELTGEDTVIDGKAVKGMAVAKSINGGEQIHYESMSGWHKIYPLLKERLGQGIEAGKPGKDLTKSMKALLRLDDESLQALAFNKQVTEDIHALRAKYNESLAAYNQKLGDKLDVIKDQSVLDSPDILDDPRTAKIPLLEQDAMVGKVDRYMALAEELGEHIEKRVAPIFSRSAASAGHDYISKNGTAITLVGGIRDTIVEAIKRQDPRARTGNLDVRYDPHKMLGQTFDSVLKDGPESLFGSKVHANVFLENVRQQLIDQKAPGFVEVTEAAAIKGQLERIKNLHLPADTWAQMRDLNQMATAADLPEMGMIRRTSESIMAWFKSGVLSWPATAMRDGASSVVNATIMGDMSPLAIGKYGPKAAAFARGKAIDPGEGIKEIEEFLQKFNRPSNAATRGEAFQTLWAAHHFGGSQHPNMQYADANIVEGADSSMRMLKSVPNVGKESMASQVTGAIKNAWNTKGVLNPLPLSNAGPLGKHGPLSLANVAGSWTTNELGQSVRRSESNIWVNTANSFRQNIDTTVRAMYVLDRVVKSRSLVEAFAMSDRVLLNADPRNFTRFEHKFLKTIIPFYSFMRQSIPMFMEEMAINPGGKLGQTIRATRLGQGDEEGYVPYQYQDTSAIPVGKSDDGSIRYLTSLGLMHEDAVAYAGNAMQGDLRGMQQKLLSSTNPALKWFVEHATNTSLFSQGPMGARRLDDLDPTMGRILTNLGVMEKDASGRAKPVLSPTAESLAAASPLSRMLSTAKVMTTSKERSGAIEKVARLLSGVRIENVTPEIIVRDVRDRLNAIQIEHGAHPLTTVIGTKGLIEHLMKSGDMKGAERLQKIGAVLAVLRKQAAKEADGTDTPRKRTTKSLLDQYRR